jgi:hypothetical protein
MTSTYQPVERGFGNDVTVRADGCEDVTTTLDARAVTIEGEGAFLSTAEVGANSAVASWPGGTGGHARVRWQVPRIGGDATVAITCQAG